MKRVYAMCMQCDDGLKLGFQDAHDMLVWTNTHQENTEHYTFQFSMDPVTHKMDVLHG